MIKLMREDVIAAATTEQMEKSRSPPTKICFVAEDVTWNSGN
jgi:hypothetical protein